MVQDSPEWREWRKGGVGASEVAAILGTCPYNTAHDIWLVKTGRKQGFEGNAFTANASAMYIASEVSGSTDRVGRAELFTFGV